MTSVANDARRENITDGQVCLAVLTRLPKLAFIAPREENPGFGCTPEVVALIHSSKSLRYSLIAFLTGQAVPSLRPQIVVAGMMPFWDFVIG